MRHNRILGFSAALFLMIFLSNSATAGEFTNWQDERRVDDVPGVSGGSSDGTTSHANPNVGSVNPMPDIGPQFTNWQNERKVKSAKRAKKKTNAAVLFDAYVSNNNEAILQRKPASSNPSFYDWQYNALPTHVPRVNELNGSGTAQ